MLQATVLNSDATINNYFNLGTLYFVPGEQVNLVLQLFNPQRSDSLRYITNPAAILTVNLPNKDGTTSTVLPSVMNTQDASIWTVQLPSTLTPLLASGNIWFTLDALGDGTQLILGYTQNALAVTITGNL